jgi:hypothetical protein
MSNQSNRNENYKNYLNYLGMYSNCIYPIIQAIEEKQSNIYDVKEIINLENYCVFERKQVQKYRNLLKENSNN